MKKSDKRSWDKLIYGLIYPGFLGSMLYELIPTGRADFTLAHFLTSDNFIRYAIILFYSLDYVHLYGDMDGLIKNPEKKSVGYFVVDVLTCLGYVAAFISLKIPTYWPIFVVFGLAPWLFLFYKRRNVYDKKFFVPYGSGMSLVVIYRILCAEYPDLLIVNVKWLALLFVVVNVIVYWYYIGWFYEKQSKSYDESVLYSRLRTNRVRLRYYGIERIRLGRKKCRRAGHG